MRYLCSCKHCLCGIYSSPSVSDSVHAIQILERSAIHQVLMTKLFKSGMSGSIIKIKLDFIFKQAVSSHWSLSRSLTPV